MRDAQKPDHLSLSTLVGRLREGRFVIPDFQRDFEWEPWDISELMRSIFLDYATVFLDVDQGNVPDERRMRLIIDVEPALIPSEEGASDDVRRLGLQLFPPVWRGRHR